MYTITQKITRPDESVEFINMTHENISIEVRQYWMTTYKITNKCIFVNVELSANKLERVVTMLWDSKDSWLEYQNDPIMDEGLFKYMRLQREENGFIKELVSEEEI